MLDFTHWENVFCEYLLKNMSMDSAHDLAHIRRVVNNAKRIADEEKANLEVIIPAAWLHDCVVVPKDSPDRNKASVMAAKEAGRFLKEIEYPHSDLSVIEHAIAAHSFSANITAETLEAKIVQDADRIDALGAIGTVRCLVTGVALQLDLYSSNDPFCQTREANDRKYTIDHFYCKLLKLHEQMNTETGRKMAKKRSDFMKIFLAQLESEICD
ncbi:HD domain-containing protein [Candidatus Uabimicrobium sp. HlEnr_7]|uniref:HD domain-containing protein n=1 Tax=Candidatus Uabimicrobium helgolandensis TaxID=3095367 RepID=UPI0035591E92